LKGGTLFISRTTAIFLWLKSVFDDNGFRDVTVSSLDRDAPAFQLNELKPGNVFINSEYYSGVTPYMIGELLVKFPKLKIAFVNFGNFSDSLAVRFIFHGAISYLDFNDGPDEFRKALKMIYSGEKYYSPGIDWQIKTLDEFPKLTREVTNREWQVLLAKPIRFNTPRLAAAVNGSVFLELLIA
jgi:DNA-binding NarL/FixJ family response regulator